MTDTLPLLTATQATQPTGDALSPLRHAGLAAFQAHGLPTRRHERWKYTALRGLADLAFVAPGEAPHLDTVPTGQALDLPGAHRIVLVNGRINPALSDAIALPGISLTPLADAVNADATAVQGLLGTGLPLTEHPFVALNTAALADGLVIRVAPGTLAAAPLHLVWITVPDDSRPLLIQPRLLIDLGRAADLTLVESQIGLAGAETLTNRVTDITLADGARLTHVGYQHDTASARHIAAVQARLQGNAVYDAFTLTLGASLSRTDLRVDLLGTGAEARLNGAYAASSGQHVDTTSFIDHAAPHCTSAQTLKGVLDGNGRGVFQGRINVQKQAQKTDGHQLHKALLLSHGAEVDAKPELTIFADDVKCSHGAATGELDEDALFYLRARGLSEPEARALLIEGFLDDVVDLVSAEPLRDALTARIHLWLEARR